MKGRKEEKEGKGGKSEGEDEECVSYKEERGEDGREEEKRMGETKVERKEKWEN